MRKSYRVRSRQARTSLRRHSSDWELPIAFMPGRVAWWERDRFPAKTASLRTRSKPIHIWQKAAARAHVSEPGPPERATRKFQTGAPTPNALASHRPRLTWYSDIDSFEPFGSRDCRFCETKPFSIVDGQRVKVQPENCTLTRIIRGCIATHPSDSALPGSARCKLRDERPCLPSPHALQNFHVIAARQARLIAANKAGEGR
jgi:hypothetical protein